jgi:phospholipase/lecithinase/hemolysin
MVKMVTHKITAKIQTILATSTLPIALVTLTPSVAHAFQFSNLYVFGDSLSDVGQFSQATGGALPPAQLGYFNGRFTNGPNWIDYLAAELGLPPSTIQTNFAIAGATTGTQNSTLSVLPGLQQEVAGFTLANPHADPNALYVVWAGSNDYLDVIGQTDPTIPVGNLANAIAALSNVGAKNILVPNLPDLGRTPLVAGRGPEVSGAVSGFVQGHNTLLAQTLTALEPQLAPQGVTLIPVDVNSLFNDAFGNPSKYGFTNTADACLFPSPLFFPPGPVTICSNPNQYLFWDSLHPTTVAHQYVAETAFEAISASAVPEPPATAGLVLFGAFLAGLTALKRKRKLEIAISPVESKQLADLNSKAR